MKTPYPSLGFLALVALSCTGTDIGNPVVDMDFALYDSEGSTAAVKSRLAVAPVGLVVDTAWVTVERIRLRPADDCDGSARDEFVGPFAIDMLAAGPAPALTSLEVSTTSYCRVEFRWDALREEGTGAPGELLDASILLGGRRADGTRFILRSERGDEMRLDARDGSFTVDDLTNALFVTFDVQDLFDGLDIDSAEVGDNNIIRIEDGENDDLLSVFDNNLADAAKLFDDKDGDGELDPDERDSTDVLAD